jgi:hypothetical protein
VHEGFGLPDPVCRVTQCVVDQSVDPLQDLMRGVRTDNTPERGLASLLEVYEEVARQPLPGSSRR